ncbi:uncharacterized protein LOC119372333 [Rhipicephalus sanguineus]|uniref:uncharacterized protein LOC119372333 n=1 Tax=Rhipicephalus sanguineus TaxID=34632 RepID=UPI0020C1F401|nr:uncharacterized protein LOC119372333 [Rhipicephalus sanguineus]
MLPSHHKPGKGRQAAVAFTTSVVGGSLQQRPLPPPPVAEKEQAVVAEKPVPHLALPAPEPKKPSSAKTWVSKEAAQATKAEAVHAAKQDQAQGTTRTTQSSNGRSTTHATGEVKTPVVSSLPASLVEAGKIKLSEPTFTWTRSIGTRKSYYFPDPPLPKEVHFAMALLVLAILSVALLLAYDVYHSFEHMPRRSNVTASSLSPTTTEPIPTPVFMR